MVQKAIEQDAAVLADLALVLWPSHDAAELRDEFIELLKSEEAACFLACEAGVPVGFAQCQLRHDYVEGTIHSPVGYLEGIFVREDHRRTGVAGKLLAACESWASAMGCREAEEYSAPHVEKEPCDCQLECSVIGFASER